MTTVTIDEPFTIDTSSVMESDGEGKIACDVCGKSVTSRGLTRHMNSAHGGDDGSGGAERAKRRLGTQRRGKKTKGLSAEVSEGLASLSGKLLILITMALAWSALRRANIPDPNGDIAESMAMTDDEAVAIGRVLSRVFASTAPGRRIAPKLVENEDVIDAAFAGWEWYQRNAKMWDELRGEASPGYVAQQVPATGERMSNNGRHGQASERGSEGEGYGYIPPSPIDIIGA